MIFSENRYPLFGITLFAEHDLFPKAGTHFSGSRSLLSMIFFRKPVPTFRDHALEHFAAATAALDQPGGGRAGYRRADPDLQILRANTGMAPAGGSRAVMRLTLPHRDRRGRGTDQYAAYDSSEIILWYSASGQARTVRVRTLPSAPICMQNLAILSPLADSTMLTRSNWPLVR